MNDYVSEYALWNEQLKNEYHSLFPDAQYTIWDGVVFPCEYAKSPLKIMFLNREPYDDEWEEYDLAEALRKELVSKTKPIFGYQTNLRLRLKEYLCVMHLLETGELLSISDEGLASRVKELTQTDRLYYEMMPSVAYVNVKKSDGIKKSYIPNLRKYAVQGQSVLKKQIAYFNPSIILAGNVVDGVLGRDDVVTEIRWADNLYSPKGRAKIRVFQLDVNNQIYPIVDMYHPSATQGWMSTYYLDLFHALKEVELSHPNYWKNRLNLQCFKN